MRPTVSQLAARCMDRIARNHPSVAAAMHAPRHYIESILRSTIEEAQRIAVQEERERKAVILPFPEPDQSA